MQFAKLGDDLEQGIIEDAVKNEFSKHDVKILNGTHATILMKNW